LNGTDTQWLETQVEAARQGNDEAFSRLVEKFQLPVFNLCYRMLGNSGEAEDAAQESFWRAYQSLKRYDPQRSFMTWLLSIAAHYCIDQLRKRRLVTLPMDVLPEEQAPDPAPNPESHYSQREEQQNLHKLLAKLNPPDRAAIIMRYWYDLSEDEIAEALSLSTSAVKSRLHRARRELAQMWQTNQAVNVPAVRRQHESSAL